MEEKMEEYKQFVRSHPAQVKRMEEIGRMVAMFMPVSKFGRFSEVVQESSYGVLGLVSLYHELIIEGAQRSVVAVRDQAQKPLIASARLALTLLAHTEIVLEMLANVLGGEERKMQLIALIEWIKAILRSVLLWHLKMGKVLIAGGQLKAQNKPKPGEEDKSQPDIEQGGRRLGTAEEAENESSIPEREQSEAQAEKPMPKWQGKRSGKVIGLPENLRGFDNVTDSEGATENGKGNSGSAEEQTASLQEEAGPEDLVLRTAGEVVHIFRPVMYVTMLRRSKAKGTWSPFLVSLLLELLAFRCVAVAAPGEQTLSPNGVGSDVIAKAIQKLIYGKTAKLPDEESAERDRRKAAFGLYAMRSPVFDSATLPAIRRFAGAFSFLPGIGASIESMVVEMVMYYHRNHFYISGS